MSADRFTHQASATMPASQMDKRQRPASSLVTGASVQDSPLLQGLSHMYPVRLFSELSRCMCCTGTCLLSVPAHACSLSCSIACAVPARVSITIGEKFQAQRFLGSI